MKEYKQEQTINPAVTILRFNEEEMKEIVMNHLKNIKHPLPDIAEISFWYEEERCIPGVLTPPHEGYIMRMTERIK